MTLGGGCLLIGSHAGGDRLVAIYRSFGPLICLQLLVPALVLFFPGITLFALR